MSSIVRSKREVQLYTYKDDAWHSLLGNDQTVMWDTVSEAKYIYYDVEEIGDTTKTYVSVKDTHWLIVNGDDLRQFTIADIKATIYNDAPTSLHGASIYTGTTTTDFGSPYLSVKVDKFTENKVSPVELSGNVYSGGNAITPSIGSELSVPSGALKQVWTLKDTSDTNTYKTVMVEVQIIYRITHYNNDDWADGSGVYALPFSTKVSITYGVNDAGNNRVILGGGGISYQEMK